jgi:hypothetical protein
MSVGSTLKHVLGIIAGILIPGASKDAANLTQSVQQEMANLYGAAARDMAAELKLDTTGMSGPEKVFALTKALVATAERDGFKGDLKILGDVLLDVAQAAYRASEPGFEAAIVALAGELTADPIVLVATQLVGSAVQKAADADLDRPAAPAAA